VPVRLAELQKLKTRSSVIDLWADSTRTNVRGFSARENLKGVDLENFIREVATTYSHETCTAEMGRDPMSVVDSRLKVYGIEKLRIADGSIMPRVPAGNTMAPCVVIGERAAEMLKAEYGL